MDRKIGLVCFANQSGLGNQTRRLAQLIKPERLLVINSASFSQNKEQHFEWYDGFSGYRVNGFPTDKEVDVFLKNLTHVFMCENPLNFRLISQAQKKGIKSFIHTNYEFCDNLKHPDLPIPDYFIMPSYWKIKEMEDKFGSDKVIYLPPPIHLNEFKAAREENMARSSGKIKFLHIVGTLAAYDRNGTKDLIESLKHTAADFSLTIRSQHVLPPELITRDHRVTYSIGSTQEPEDLYKGFDVLVLPRRYGGLCLPCDEALACAMPVIMPDVSPNHELLPDRWLAHCGYEGSFMTRIMIDYFSVKPQVLAQKLEEFTGLSQIELESEKMDAFEIAHKQFGADTLRERYEALWQK